MPAEIAPTRRSYRPWLSAAVLAACVLAQAPEARAAVLPPGFQEFVAFSGFSAPTVVKFASDGRVFVAEKSGVIKVFSSLADSSPDVITLLPPRVMNYWDRGLLGFEIDPAFPAQPYVYVAYVTDAPAGGVEPTFNDACGDPLGLGCMVDSRVSRLQISAQNTVVGPEHVLVEGRWCQQFPSHAGDALAFGPEGALYVSGGDGAAFSFQDHGQNGNVCNDPPNQGGALRSQDLLTSGDPASFDGTIIRIDPTTGAALPDNPLVGGDPTDDPIIAYGLRNPFRMAFRPGTSELWIGDVGWGSWEEVNVMDVTEPTVKNMGWPCYEGFSGAYTSEPLCQSLYANGPTVGVMLDPYYAYVHWAPPDPAVCGTGGAAIAGIAFYEGGGYPSQYNGSLVFADYTKACIWAMQTGGGADPNPANIVTLVGQAQGPVHVEIGPGGDVFYVDYWNGAIRRISYFANNQPPIASATADVTTGALPLTVHFNGAASVDPDGQPLSYAWDLDGDGLYDDSTSATPSFTYTQQGIVTVGLKVTDPFGASGTTTLTISPGNTPPTADIASPSSLMLWEVGDVIVYSGVGTDAEDGPMPASSMTWRFIMQHCTLGTCHAHVIQTIAGVASGTLVAPDHEYPSYIDVELTVTDSGGLTDTATVSILPRPVDLTIDTVPSGLLVTLGDDMQVTPFTRTVTVGSTNSLAAISPQPGGSTTYAFSSWSDGLAMTHDVIAPGVATSYVATFIADRDLDGVADTQDNCPDLPNPLQLDGDLDGIGDACDPLCKTFQRAAGKPPSICQDTMIASDPANPVVSNTPYGAVAQLTVGAWASATRRSLVKFDLGSIPAASPVLSSALTLRKSQSPGQGTVNLHAILGAWAEATTTWNTFGSAFAALPFASVTTGTIPNGGYATVGLRDLTQQWINGVLSNQGVLLDEPGAARATFGSSEAALASRPKLDVCYIDDRCIVAVVDPATQAVTLAAVDTSDDDACTVDACDPATGAVTNVPVDLDDGIACTVDSCDPVTGVAHLVPPEVCDGIDNDCDGFVDEPGALGEAAYYVDADGDGVGSDSTILTSCVQPPGFVAAGGDCNDGDPSAYPGAAEVCDGRDNDCDGVVDQGSVCPCTTAYYGSHAYLYCFSFLPWQTARATCQSYGYDLVSVADAQENQWVVNSAYAIGYGSWWMGLDDIAVEGAFVWSNGSPVTYTNWHAGEPNNLNNEDCMQLGWFGGYTWNDLNCSQPLPFVCESL
jgi:glucose/arabinose dehydrogenase